MAEEKVRKKKMLARRDEFRLADWLRSKGLPKDKAVPIDPLAAMATKDLGLEVTPRNIKNVANDLNLGIRFDWGKGNKNPSGTTIRLRRLEAEVLVLRQYVEHLYSRLSEAFPVLRDNTPK